MTSLKFQIDGLDVELSHPNIELRKPKLSVKGLAQFVCPSCGRKTLSIDGSDIRQCGKATKSDGKHMRGIFDAVKVGYEIARERKEIEDDQKADFVAYVQKLAIWRRKNQSKFDYSSNGAESSISVTCPLCNNRHAFRVKIANPLNTDWDTEPDITAEEQTRGNFYTEGDFTVEWQSELIKIWEKRGIKENTKNLELLESICASSLPYTEHAQEFLLRINQLNKDLQKIAKFIQAIKMPIEKADFESDSAQKWLHDLTLSLDAVAKILEKNLEEQLTACLKSISDFAVSPMTEEVA